MKIEKANMNDLISPEYNPRSISIDEMEKLKRSLTEFGYVDPVIVNKHNNHIVGGNQRFEALKQLGYDEIEVIYINEPDLNKEKALNVALNKISGEFDTFKLTEMFKDFELTDFDFTLTGFDDFEVDELFIHEDIEYDDDIDQFKDILKEEPEKEEVEVEEAPNTIICPHCGEEIEL